MKHSNCMHCTHFKITGKRGVLNGKCVMGGIAVSSQLSVCSLFLDKRALGDDNSSRLSSLPRQSTGDTKMSPKLSESSAAAVVTDALTPAASVEGESLLVTGFSFQEGKFGEFAVIECVVGGTGEVANVGCGGVVVLKQLHALNPKKDLPLECSIVKKGKAWILADPATPSPDGDIPF